MNYSSLLTTLIDGKSLSIDTMTQVMKSLMTGQLSNAQIAAFVTALRIKGESVEEITAAARVMRDLATPVGLDREHLIDIVGTGGDGHNTFNVSTTTCFVVAACGGQVAKHGNRSVSSRSGSADLLEAAGVNIELSPEQVKQCVKECGIGFMYAPMHHKAMKHAIKVRKELGIRTLFNLLGPLTNPANASTQIIGVYDLSLVQPIAKVLINLGVNNAMVLHAEDGLDEISISARTHVAEYRNNQFRTYTIDPKDHHRFHSSLDAIKVGDEKESLALMHQVLKGQAGPASDIVVMNAGAALYCAKMCDNLDEGFQLASQTLQSGAAAQKLNQLVQITQAMKKT